MRQKLMIYHLFVYKHWPRWKLFTAWRSLIAPTDLLSLVNIIGEKQSVKCRYCGHINKVKSSEKHRAGNHGPLVSDISKRAVLGSLHAGMGNTHLNNLSLTMNIPAMNHCLVKRREREVGNSVENVARESCEMNLDLEKKFLSNCLVQGWNCPFGIAISYDMGWQKRGMWWTNSPANSQRNESLNSTISSENTKTCFYGVSESNNFRVACGVAQTNIGYDYIGQTLEVLNIEPGY